jgi:hypothetical protein
MKMVFLFLLILAILTASHYGAALPAAWRRPTD